MSETKTYNVETAADPSGESQPVGNAGKPAKTSGGWDGYSNWLNRGPKPTGRHAAITKSLYTWSNYKSWADKVRSSWDDDK
jgi:hypothetical protein